MSAICFPTQLMNKAASLAVIKECCLLIYQPSGRDFMKATALRTI